MKQRTSLDELLDLISPVDQEFTNDCMLKAARINNELRALGLSIDDILPLMDDPDSTEPEEYLSGDYHYSEKELIRLEVLLDTPLTQ